MYAIVYVMKMKDLTELSETTFSKEEIWRDLSEI